MVHHNGGLLTELPVAMVKDLFCAHSIFFYPLTPPTGLHRTCSPPR